MHTNGEHTVNEIQLSRFQSHRTSCAGFRVDFVKSSILVLTEPIFCHKRLLFESESIENEPQHRYKHRVAIEITFWLQPGVGWVLCAFVP